MRSCRFYGHLSLIQMLGLAVAVVAAAVNIESIMVSGPVLSVIGLVVALGWKSCRCVLLVVFGLSALAVSLFLLVLINLLNWSPGDAQFPVTVMLIGYETIIAPGGLFGSYRALTRPADGRESPPIQYSLKSLLVASLIAGLIFTGVKVLADRGCDLLLAVAVGAAVAVGVAVAVALAAARAGSCTLDHE